MRNQKPKPQPKKNTVLGIVIEPELREKIQAAADRENRPISQFARIILKRAMEENPSTISA